MRPPPRATRPLAPSASPTGSPPWNIPRHFEVRLVSLNGGIRWHHDWVNVSHVLGGQYVGLDEVDDDQWDLYLG